MGEDVTETLEVVPRQWKVIQPRFEKGRPGEVHLPGLREDQPAARTLPPGITGLGGAEPAGDDRL